MKKHIWRISVVALLALSMLSLLGCGKRLERVSERFSVAEVRGGSILLTSEGGYEIVLYESNLDEDMLTENGETVDFSTLRAGDVIEVEWSGIILTSDPGLFGNPIYAVRVVERAVD